MAEVAVLLGWDDVKDPPRQTKKKLLRMEQKYGVKVVHRAGKNTPSWVTWAGLRSLGLVDDLAEEVQALDRQRSDLSDQFEELKKQVRVLAKAILHTRRHLDILTAAIDPKIIEKIMLNNLENIAEKKKKRKRGRKHPEAHDRYVEKKRKWLKSLAENPVVTAAPTDRFAPKRMVSPLPSHRIIAEENAENPEKAV